MIHRTNLFRQLMDKINVWDVYKKLDWLWNAGQFVPSPVKTISRDFQVTETESLYLILGWKEYQSRGR